MEGGIDGIVVLSSKGCAAVGSMDGVKDGATVLGSKDGFSDGLVLLVARVGVEDGTTIGSKDSVSEGIALCFDNGSDDGMTLDSRDVVVLGTNEDSILQFPHVRGQLIFTSSKLHLLLFRITHSQSL